MYERDGGPVSDAGPIHRHGGGPRGAQHARQLEREALVLAEANPLLQRPLGDHGAAHVQVHDAVGGGFARGARGLQSVGAPVDGQRRAADDRAQLHGCP
jgi:hypothetical protein